MQTINQRNALHRLTADDVFRAQNGPAYNPHEDDGYRSDQAWCSALGWACVGVMLAWLVVAWI